jgi:hypothetical protein
MAAFLIDRCGGERNGPVRRDKFRASSAVRRASRRLSAPRDRALAWSFAMFDSANLSRLPRDLEQRSRPPLYESRLPVVCAVCGQTYDLGQLAQAYWHDPESHEPICP